MGALDIDIVIYLLGLASVAGMILSRIKELEKKVEKHSDLASTVILSKNSVDVAHKRIDALKEKLDTFEHEVNEKLEMMRDKMK